MKELPKGIKKTLENVGTELRVVISTISKDYYKYESDDDIKEAHLEYLYDEYEKDGKFEIDDSYCFIKEETVCAMLYLKKLIQ